MKIVTVPRLTAVLCLSALTLAGCGGGGSSKSSTPAASSAAATTTAVATTESSAAAPTTTSAAAPASTTRPTTSAPAVPAGKPFTVTLPAGYKSDPSKASGVVIAYYAGPIVGGNFSVNVNVTQEPAGGATVQQAQRLAVTGIKKAIKISKLSKVSSLKLDGEPALSYSFEDTQSGLHLKQGQVVVLHKNFAYVITFTAPVTYFSAQSPKASTLIKSLKFR